MKMKTENEQIVGLLREELIRAHDFADLIAAKSELETGHARTSSVASFVTTLEKISRIEALIARYS
jgi:hypothetical protein